MASFADKRARRPRAHVEVKLPDDGSSGGGRPPAGRDLQLHAIDEPAHRHRLLAVVAAIVHRRGLDSAAGAELRAIGERAADLNRPLRRRLQDIVRRGLHGRARGLCRRARGLVAAGRCNHREQRRQARDSRELACVSRRELRTARACVALQVSPVRRAPLKSGSDESVRAAALQTARGVSAHSGARPSCHRQVDELVDRLRHADLPALDAAASAPAGSLPSCALVTPVAASARAAAFHSTPCAVACCGWTALRRRGRGRWTGPPMHRANPWFRWTEPGIPPCGDSSGMVRLSASLAARGVGSWS